MDHGPQTIDQVDNMDLMVSGAMCGLCGCVGLSLDQDHQQLKKSTSIEQSKGTSYGRVKLHTNASSSLSGRMGGTLLRRYLLLRVRAVAGLHLDCFGLQISSCTILFLYLYLGSSFF